MAMLLVSAIAVTTATYAWFTSSTTAAVSPIGVNVAAASGLELSATGVGGWKSTLSYADLKAQTSTNLSIADTGAFVPVSTTTAVTGSGGNQKMTFFDGNLLNDQLTSNEITTTAGQNGQYIGFDIYVRVNDDTQLYLSDGTNFVVDSNDPESYINLTQAMRVGFIDNGAVAGEANVPQWASNMIVNTSSSDAYVWEPNSATHQGTTFVGTKVDESGNSAEKYTYRGIKKALSNVAIADVNTDTNSTEVTTTKTPIQFPGSDNCNDEAYSNCKVCELKKGINKLRVYVWVEGQDDDCVNSVSGSDIQLNIKFAIPSAD
jgi:hypothetical protein